MRIRKYVMLALVIAIISGALALQMPTFVRAFSGPDEDLLRLKDVLGRIKEHYVEEVSTDVLIEGALRGMVDALDDPYSAYLSPDDYREFQASTSGTFGGVGIVITCVDGYVTVVSPIKGTPGERAGLRPADRILSIDGQDVRGLSVDVASRLILGEPGTQVILGVQRESEQLSYAITREMIEVNPVDYKMLPEKLGYIELTSFNEHAADRLAEALNALADQGARGIVLDLRGNPGGLLNQALEVARQFVPSGPVVFVEERGSAKQRVLSSKLKASKWPLVVLVDGGSASAAEIVAGAVQDRAAGILVGERTFGKATVQDVYSLSDGGALKITIGRYLTPSGRDINKEGIIPDVTVAAGQDRRPTALNLGRVLRPGTGGLDVAELQKRLQVLGYEMAEVDGIYTGQTVEAIRQLQVKGGLEPDGHVGKYTLDVINKRLLALSEQDPQLEKAVELLRGLIAERSKTAA